MEDFLKMGGEAMLTQLVDILKDEEETPLLMNVMVTVATMYKNSISLTDFTSCKLVLQTMMQCLSKPISKQFEKKLLYAMNIIIANKPEMGESFLNQNGISILVKYILGSDKDLKRKSLGLFKSLLRMFETDHSVATSNICSQTLLDLTSADSAEDYPLIQSYFELLQYLTDNGD